MGGDAPQGWTPAALGGPWPAVELAPPSAYDAARAVLGGPPPAAFLLNEARACEPAMLLDRRTRLLGEAARTAAGREVREVEAERAVDAARRVELDDAESAARALLALDETAAGPVARSRALEAFARSLLWRGDEVSAAQGAELAAQAVDAYLALGSREWAGHAQFWIGNTRFLQRGLVDEAATWMRTALDTLDPRSPRRANVLSFLADSFEALGDWAAFDAALAEADTLLVDGDVKTRAYLAWSRARGAASRRDPVRLARYLAEVEDNTGDWYDIHTGSTFLGDAAVLSARVGDRDRAAAYLARAQAKDPHDEFVLMAEAELLARDGDPEEALAAIGRLGHQRWLEIRQLWRFDLLAAWATLRAGRDPGRRAASGFDRAAAMGRAVAATGEPELVRLLAPAAARAGSSAAQALLGPVQVRLLGESTVVRDGVALPRVAGLPGTLLRLVAAHPEGLAADEVVEALWPESGTRPLRDALSRLRSRVGDVVVRQGDRLVLPDAWVDLTAFRAAADRALSDRREGLVLAALALWTGTPLPADPYAQWAIEVREPLQRRRLRLLDLAAELHADRPARAVSFLELAVEADPYDTHRHERLAALSEQLDRPAEAARWRRRAHDLD